MSAVVRGRVNGRLTTLRPASRLSACGSDRTRIGANGHNDARTCETLPIMTSNLSLAARVISEGFLPARSALLQGPRDPVSGPVSSSRLRGMLLGLAIGDALGNTSEGLSPEQRAARHGEIRDYLPNSRAAGHRVGLPSDDSQLAFWTLESLLERGGLDPDDLSARFASREIFGLGKSMQQFLRNRAQGATSWYHYGAESAGNGALMRIAPIVLLHPHGTSAALWLDVALASIVTHRDASSVASCVAFVDLLARLLRLPAPPTSDWIIATFVATVRQVCTDQPYRARSGRFIDREGSFPDYLEFVLGEAARHDWSTRAACDAWSSGAYLLETVPSVLWILARHAHEPEEAIVRAVNDTHDNDTVATLVGAAVGALHGKDGLPVAWQHGLLGRTTVDDNGRVFRLIEQAVRQELS
jgi:ADP-ribosyl-[dinitrogen reductase] hydrolase